MFNKIATLVAFLLIITYTNSYARNTLVPETLRINEYNSLRKLALLYTWTKQYPKAKSIYEKLLLDSPENSLLLADYADLKLAQGHALRCRSLYRKALHLSNGDEKIKLRMADAMLLWGDFYQAEIIFKEHIKKNPSDFIVKIKLARLLMSAQRYEKSLGLYFEYERQGYSKEKIFAALCELKWATKDLDGCLFYGQKTYELNQKNPLVLELLGKAYLRKNNLKKADIYFTNLSQVPKYEIKGLVGKTRSLIKQGKIRESKLTIESALEKKPNDANAVYLQKKLTSPQGGNDVLPEVLRSSQVDSLMDWAEVYREQGEYKNAIACYKALLDIDPEYFPAQIGLAEVYGINHEYDKAIVILKSLIDDFPNVFKLEITYARILAWSKRYQEALDRYQNLSNLNPNDTVPIKEAARTALWAKDIQMAQELYNKLLYPSLDLLLAKRIKADYEKVVTTALDEELRKALIPANTNEIFGNYEDLKNSFKQHYSKIYNPQKKEIQNIINLFMPDYLIQKQTFLELKAKENLWDKYFYRSLKSYTSLLSFQPGNLEARFDLAQAQCALGLKDKEKNTYQKILQLDPNHSRAQMALANIQRLDNPHLGIGYGRWQENGYGERAQITRHRADIPLSVPVYSRFTFMVSGHMWWEQPTRWAGESKAKGLTLAGFGPISDRLKLSLALTHKDYTQKELSDLDTGHVHFGINLNDYGILGISWLRENSVQNAFSIKQGIQTDSFVIDFKSNLTRKFKVELDLRYFDYSDDNQGLSQMLNLGYSFWDHPRELMIGLLLEHRDHENPTQEIYQGSQLVQMIHPYWAPENWWGKSLILEWKHDLGEALFCGAEKHFYDLRFSLSGDNEDNPGWEFQATWHLEFCNHFDLEAKGLWHRSSKWDANGFWLKLGYRF